ncbi:V/A-type H+-transporting ATPase subunit A [Caloramator quimbayensis]|uniref:V-type ATP synthase alpha chain n=1 Tax=Caloramator quimbayensis TaxID=1147123 RepID=A0A1T4XM00_9CLOT|nr:V-type ATP synthase subunit A [Caloramator quimbayensis]SKA90546.1 V/A-type H+-transporting ATPase subunit A [Caloramator quimbayensis]
MDKIQGIITYINGPVIKAKNMEMFKMREMVTVGEKRLIGEIISIDGDIGTVQVYEETTGLKIGEKIDSTGKPLSVKLGPGIIGNIFDGIQRPLNFIYEKSGGFISEGIGLASIDLTKKWDVTVLVKEGDTVKEGSVFATVKETPLITHKLMIPPGINGKIVYAEKNGTYDLEEVLLKIDDGKTVHDIKMYQEWPVRTPRPVKERMPIEKPLITGQRVIDTFFPVAKGGTAAIPGGFGTGKTMTQHQLAKWSDADIIVYIGCGERGNEMTEVLEDFPKLIDPNSNLPLMNRTILIANTSNMPVAAREASIYTGITIAEYFRDMGYNVAIMADSTSRWAEALREISGRLEEMPAEEGYPAYLPSRLAEFYERAGYVTTLGDDEASVTIIGAVSPAGGDFSEPVTQNTKRFVGAFLGLDKKLAYARHYPAINWLSSYSGYLASLNSWYRNNVSEDMMNLRGEMLRVLQEESKLLEIVKLVGEDVLPDEQRLILEIAKLIKIGYLQQNAYHKDDTYVPLNKQYRMLKVIKLFYEHANEVIKKGIPISKIKSSQLYNDILKMKYSIPNDYKDEFDNFENQIITYFDSLIEAYEG